MKLALGTLAFRRNPRRSIVSYPFEGLKLECELQNPCHLLKINSLRITFITEA